MAEIVELGLRIAGEIDLLCAIEDGDEVALVDFGAIGDEFSEGHWATLAPDLGDEDFGGTDGFDDTGDADFTFGSRSVGSGGVGYGGRSTRTGNEEREEKGD
jgi:hypothetical protein